MFTNKLDLGKTHLIPRQEIRRLSFSNPEWPALESCSHPMSNVHPFSCTSTVILGYRKSVGNKPVVAGPEAASIIWR